jgi:hypothetical protein
VIGAAAVAGAVLAWLSMSVLVLSESRGGLALGLAGAGVGLGAALGAGGRWGGAAVALGAVAAALLRTRDGAAGWGILPAGSTPRVMLCFVVGAACAWAGGSLLGGSLAPARSAILAAIVLASARLMTTGRRQAALAAASALAVGIGALGGFAASQSELVLAVAGGLVAVLLAAVPAAEGGARGT